MLLSCALVDFSIAAIALLLLQMQPVSDVVMLLFGFTEINVIRVRNLIEIMPFDSWRDLVRIDSENFALRLKSIFTHH